MKADHLSFKKATGVCLTGLAIQLVLGLALLVYSLVFRDPSAFPGSLFVLAGSLVWVTLAVVFDQHRRERIEAMESESLAHVTAREASVFGERPDDMRVAAKRLAWMHKILVPVGGVLFALLLTGLGIWTFRMAHNRMSIDQFKSLKEPGWAIALGVALAVIGFVFGRYTSALSKQKGWENLRAGAAQAAGAALIGLAIFVAQLVDQIGPDLVARYLIIAVPIAMFVIAAETILNFLLGLYRPRRPGEVPRAAFESRILGFIAAPDRIAESIGGALNYQFGFDVTGSWFYQLLSRSVAALVLVGLVVMWMLTCIGVVQPNEQGLRIRMGAQVGERLGPGPYIKLPWPFERIERFESTIVRRINLGGDQPKVRNSILWTNDHGVAESFFVVQPSGFEASAGASGRNANDVSLVSAEVPLLYEVSDLSAFERLAAPDQREDIIRAVARREVFKYFATAGLDAVLGRGRSEVSKDLRAKVEEELTKLNAGIKVLHVGIEGVHPPKDTAEMFEEVVQSHQKRAGNIETAQMQANQTLIKVAGSVESAHAIVQAIDAVEAATKVGADARKLAEAELNAEAVMAKAKGSAAAKLQAAKAERWEAHMKARARAEGYEGELASFKACPQVYMSQVYFDTLVDVMNKSRLYIVADDPDRLWIEVDQKDQGVTGNLFKDNTKKPEPE